MSLISNFESKIETGTGTNIKSHKSFDPEVDAICHHSGQYLTASEKNHTILARLVTRTLKEQHEFPGLRNLDSAFKQAVHAFEHQHLNWSRIAIWSIPTIIFSLLQVLFGLYLFTFSDYVHSHLFILFISSLIAFNILGICLFIWALSSYQRREILFHQNAKHLPPAVNDYPVQGVYRINTTEKININLDNLDKRQPEIKLKRGEFNISLKPFQQNWESYSEYKKQYEEHPVAGQYLNGGTIAFENLNHIKFNRNKPEFGHRIVLREPVNQQTIHDDENIQVIEKKFEYTIEENQIIKNRNGLKRFPLDIEPKLAPHDSRTLELHFHWRFMEGSGLETCRLQECILEIPDSLGKVTRVTYGRYDQGTGSVIWRNRSFRKNSLILSITFEEPILRCMEQITGTYQVNFDGAISGLESSKNLVWTVLGTKADPDLIHISNQTDIYGDLTLGLQRLSQEHEYVESMPSISFNSPPNELLVRAVTDVLLIEGFDLQRITKTAPRLDPTGRLEKQLHYWDIIGRKYNEELLDSLDVHVIITGTDKLIHSIDQDNSFNSETTIDLRIRCLHDPRNAHTKQAISTLIGREDSNSLAQKIKDAVHSKLRD